MTWLLAKVAFGLAVAAYALHITTAALDEITDDNYPPIHPTTEVTAP